MNRLSRKLMLKIATGVAVAATALVVFLPAANAAPGVVTGNVNVRSGPGTNYAVVDTLVRGTQVDVQRCQGSWCYVEKPGPDGWVSASYLSAQGRPVNPSQPGLSFGFTIGGPDGPQINIGVGNGNIGPRPPVIRPEPPRPSRAQACFFEYDRMGGDSFCLRPGESQRVRGGIGSIENRAGLTVELCTDRGRRDDCRTYTTGANSLGWFGNSVSTVRVAR
ncbi:SH3 domain-containing protein [Devosia sp.]|uniref:SH3 domain-containing protein n=1 Tax=Devosia sp. TaxID=1871048 RepID=UPI002AFE7723|nr:SH3 domain-containing protein [Devosia sp.]